MICDYVDWDTSSHVGDHRVILVLNCYGVVMSVVDELRKLAELKRDQRKRPPNTVWRSH